MDSNACGKGLNSEIRRRIHQIVGLRKEESDALLELLFCQTLVRALQLRVNRKPGTLTVWDNKRAQHYAVRDRISDRLLHRVMIDTTRPGAQTAVA